MAMKLLPTRGYTILAIKTKNQRNSDCHRGCDERQWLSAGYAWHSRPRTTTLSSNLRNGGDESG